MQIPIRPSVLAPMIQRPTIDNEANFRSGSISELITLDAPGSGDERKAELNCCLIYGVFSSQFGQKQPLARLEKPRRGWQNL